MQCHDDLESEEGHIFEEALLRLGISEWTKMQNDSKW